MPYENAYAALIDDDNIVREIIVIPYMEDDDEKITEYCNSIGLEGRWIDCAFTGSRRGRYPFVGNRYDETLDEFVIIEPESE